LCFQIGENEAADGVEVPTTRPHLKKQPLFKGEENVAEQKLRAAVGLRKTRNRAQQIDRAPQVAAVEQRTVKAALATETATDAEMNYLVAANDAVEATIEAKRARHSRTEKQRQAVKMKREADAKQLAEADADREADAKQLACDERREAEANRLSSLSSRRKASFFSKIKMEADQRYASEVRRAEAAAADRARRKAEREELVERTAALELVAALERAEQAGRAEIADVAEAASNSAGAVAGASSSDMSKVTAINTEAAVEVILIYFRASI
jgi:colicin import membrane protein